MGIALKKGARRWMKEPGFKKGDDDLEEKLAPAHQFIDARTRAGLTQFSATFGGAPCGPS
jgi:hypothetical protein